MIVRRDASDLNSFIIGGALIKPGEEYHDRYCVMRNASGELYISYHTYSDGKREYKWKRLAISKQRGATIQIDKFDDGTGIKVDDTFDGLRDKVRKSDDKPIASLEAGTNGEYGRYRYFTTHWDVRSNCKIAEVDLLRMSDVRLELDDTCIFNLSNGNMVELKLKNYNVLGVTLVGSRFPEGQPSPDPAKMILDDMEGEIEDLLKDIKPGKIIRTKAGNLHLKRHPNFSADDYKNAKKEALDKHCIDTEKFWLEYNDKPKDTMIPGLHGRISHEDAFNMLIYEGGNDARDIAITTSEGGVWERLTLGTMFGNRLVRMLCGQGAEPYSHYFARRKGCDMTKFETMAPFHAILFPFNNGRWGIDEGFYLRWDSHNKRFELTKIGRDFDELEYHKGGGDRAKDIKDSTSGRSARDRGRETEGAFRWKGWSALKPSAPDIRDSKD